jgi:tetratricopeptide (TPR) repeat protein
MTTLRALTIVWLLAATAAASAQSASYSNRDEAVHGAASPNADTRAEALAWIAGHGTQADATVLKEHLTDDNAHVRSVAEQALWTLWSRSGDDAVDGLLAAGVEQMRTGDLDGAIATFSAVITQKPEFAEGWNKRATALFLAGEFRRSLEDCDEVMKRNPLHFGALAKYLQIYLQLEQYERAIAYWKRALDVNPNLSASETSIRST